MIGGENTPATAAVAIIAAFESCSGSAASSTASVNEKTIPVTIAYRNDRVGGEMELPADWRVNLDDALLERLREWLTPENVQVLY